MIFTSPPVFVFWQSRAAAVGGCGSYPPFRSKLPKGHRFPGFVIQHNFNLLIIIRHQLNHQLPTSATGGARFAVWHDCKNLFHLMFPTCDHMKIALRSAQIPSVEQVSIQTPVYMVPDRVRTAAATPPASTYSDIFRSCWTIFAAWYISSHVSSILLFHSPFLPRCHRPEPFASQRQATWQMRLDSPSIVPVYFLPL